MNDGILQRFVVPKEVRNTVVRVLWTPHFCLYERRVNHLLLNDRRYDLYERACTYEGKEYYSHSRTFCPLSPSSVPLRGKLAPSNIQRVVSKVVEVNHAKLMMLQHVNAITFGQIEIQRLVLYVKVDKRERVWVLWSNSIKTVGEENGPVQRRVIICRMS